jgi:hypothetical protein
MAHFLFLGQGAWALHRRVRVAQWIARLPPKQKVAGSNPASDVESCPFASRPDPFGSLCTEPGTGIEGAVCKQRPINSVGRVTGS